LEKQKLTATATALLQQHTTKLKGNPILDKGNQEWDGSACFWIEVGCFHSFNNLYSFDCRSQDLAP
jgi:hypothetical protein